MGGSTGDDSLILELSDWLIDQAFGEPEVDALFAGLCERLHAIGIPLERGFLAWSTLHPLVDSESVVWRPGMGARLESYLHAQDDDTGWLNSPTYHLVTRRLPLLRRRLDGPGALRDFPILQDLAEEGFTDYLALATRFRIPRIEAEDDPGGILTSWATRHPDGFTDEQIGLLQRTQRRLALTCKTSVLSRITRNIADAYLGRIAASRVLSGQIRHGDGEAIDAVVWYSDLRNSTALAEAMPRETYLALLNAYFDCVAGAALAAGGEVLDFIGDAVLVIFPYREPGGFREAAGRACRAIADAEERRQDVLATDPGLPLDFGIGVNAGTVEFGNIGVPERLAFSVIGPTVNQVARIEKLTKDSGVTALATGVIAEAAPDLWRPAGARAVVGLSAPLELFGWIGGAPAPH